MGDQSSEFRKIPYARQCIEDADIESVVAALKSDFITQGPRIESFEKALSEVTGARYAIAVSSGTAALHLSYQGLGLGKGDIGVVPAITFAATANALGYCGSTPAFCDVESTSGLATAVQFKGCIEKLETNDLRASLLAPVSYSGKLCDLENIAELARGLGAYVVEDAAHSLGAVRGGSRSGSCDHSDAAILSFHPVKHVCSGEGGAVLTNDSVLARRVRNLRSHGIEKFEDQQRSEGGWTYAQTELGWNYRMTDLQASLGASQLARLDWNLARRREIVARYQQRLAKEPFASCFGRPSDAPDSSWHLYVIRFVSPEMRRAAYDFLQARGIGVQVHYIPVYQHPYYKKAGHRELPGAETFYGSCLSLPLYPALSDKDQEFVVDALAEFCQSVQ